MGIAPITANLGRDMQIRIPTRVISLIEKKRIVEGTKDEEGNALLTSQTLGWFVHFEGSYESLFVGHQKPTGLDPGTEVDILIIPK